MQVKIHVADNHPSIIEGFKSLFEHYPIEVVGSSLNGLETVNWFKNNTADILLLDISMPEMTGIDVLKWFDGNNFLQKTIIVSDYLDEHYLAESLRLGANAYLNKSEVHKNIIDCINKVLTSNEVYLCSRVKEFNESIRKANLSGEINLEERLYGSGLSDKQVQIVKMFADEHSSKEISEKLDILESTFRTHVQKIKSKLRIKNLVGLVRYIYARMI